MLTAIHRSSFGRAKLLGLGLGALALIGCHVTTSGSNPDASAPATTTSGTTGGIGTTGGTAGSSTGAITTGGSATTGGGATTGGQDAAVDSSRPDSGDASRDAGAEAGVGTIVRTYAYHQLTAYADTKLNPTAAPVVSANGSRIAFTVSPGSEDPTTPNKIYVMNNDGTGLKVVDSYTTGCFCGSRLAISADGNTVVSTESVNLRVVGADGTLKGKLALSGNNIWGRPLISGDGSRVVFVIDRDTTIASMGNMAAQRGVWVMAADGSGVKQIAGPDAVVGLVGGKADDVFPFHLCGQNVAFSDDGTKVAFGAFTSGFGDTLFGVGFDGSALHKIIGPVMPPAGSSIAIFRISLSGDGKTLAYRQFDPAGDSFLATVGFDGSSGKTLAKNPPTYFGGGCDSEIALTTDGSRALISETGLVVPTDGTSDHITLQPATGSYSSDLNGIGNGSSAFSMTGDGKRFLFQNVENAGLPVQLGMLEIDPASLAAAPALTMPSIFPGAIPRDRSIAATVSTQVTGSGLGRVGTAVLLRGDPDTAGSWVAGTLVLLDDGKAPDTASADGVYVAGGLSAGSGAEVGPRVVRIKAETKAPDGRRHATAIDVAGFAIK